MEGNGLGGRGEMSVDPDGAQGSEGVKKKDGLLIMKMFT